MRFYDEALVPKDALDFELIPLRSIKQYVVDFRRINVYLFSFKILWKEVWHSVYVEYSDFYYEIFMLEKRGVTSWTDTDKKRVLLNSKA